MCCSSSPNHEMAFLSFGIWLLYCNSWDKKKSARYITVNVNVTSPTCPSISTHVESEPLYPDTYWIPFSWCWTAQQWCYTTTQHAGHVHRKSYKIKAVSHSAAVHQTGASLRSRKLVLVTFGLAEALKGHSASTPAEASSAHAPTLWEIWVIFRTRKWDYDFHVWLSTFHGHKEEPASDAHPRFTLKSVIYSGHHLVSVICLWFQLFEFNCFSFQVIESDRAKERCECVLFEETPPIYDFTHNNLHFLCVLVCFQLSWIPASNTSCGRRLCTRRDGSKRLSCCRLMISVRMSGLTSRPLPQRPVWFLVFFLMIRRRRTEFWWGQRTGGEWRAGLSSRQTPLTALTGRQHLQTFGLGQQEVAVSCSGVTCALEPLLKNVEIQTSPDENISPHYT